MSMQSYVSQVITPGGLSTEEMIRLTEMYKRILLEVDTSKTTFRIARTYAVALLDAAEKQGLADVISSELETLIQNVFVNSPALERFLSSQAVTRKRKDEILERVLANRANPLLVDFLRLLNRKDRISLIRPVVVAYETVRELRANRVRVVVEAAAPLNQSQIEALQQSLSEALKKSPILLIRENPDLLGGLVIRIGDKVYDTSVSTRLRNFRNQLLARGTYEIQSGRDRFCHNG